MGVYYFTCDIDGGFEKEHSSIDPRNPCPLCRIAELEEALQAVVDWMIPRTNVEGEAYDKVLAALEGE